MQSFGVCYLSRDHRGIDLSGHNFFELETFSEWSNDELGAYTV